MDQLDALSIFTLVAGHSGFGRASRASGVPKASLSRKVAALERNLGVRLVERGQKELRLTAEGESLLRRIRGPRAELTQASDDVRGGIGVLAGTLRISAPILFAHVAMGQVLADFLLLHPALRIEATADDRLIDLVEEGYDLVIRINPPVDDNLVGRRFLTDRIVVVAHPSVPQPHQPEEPVRAVLLGRVSQPDQLRFSRDGTPHQIVLAPVLRASSMIMVHQAVRAGAGVAALPLSLVAADLAKGHLTLWGEVPERPVNLWVLHASQRLASPRVTAFVQFLVDRFGGGEFQIPPE